MRAGRLRLRRVEDQHIPKDTRNTTYIIKEEDGTHEHAGFHEVHNQLNEEHDEGKDNDESDGSDNSDSATVKVMLAKVAYILKIVKEMVVKER
jgi:hypothetical protein